MGAPAAARAAGPCGTTPGLVCSDVVVPLDRSGAVPGTVDLHVESLPPSGQSSGAVFLLAGGPGQGSAHTFDLGDPQSASLFRFLFPGYTLVAYDDRGTGNSGLLNCPALQVSTDPSGQDLLASACASSIGPPASFYGTVDHAADLDAVRASLGLDKIALYGVSYGTKLALAYAATYPTHVARLVLDSEFPAPELSFALYAATDCRDGPFPWPADSAPSARPGLLRSAIAALPPGTFGPFGTWAADLGNASLCDTWPTPSGGVNLSPAAYPNVPVLALSGGFDMRTPTEGAQSVVAQFPQGKLVVVPGVGHSVVTTDPSGCAALAVHDWMLDTSTSRTCSRPPFLVAPIAAFPRAPSRTAGSAATFALATRTITEAE